MNKVIEGVIHGSTIELNENPGFAEGQTVHVFVQPVQSPRPWGEGIRRSAGALADQWTEDDDRILEEIYQDRKRDHRELPA